MTELTIEQARAKELEQEKWQIIEPIIKGLNLKKEEAKALVTLDKKCLQHIVKKYEDVINNKSHRSLIVDPAKPAKILWAVAKSACPPGEKIDPQRMYSMRVNGVMVLSCFTVARQLYEVAENQKNDSLCPSGEDKK